MYTLHIIYVGLSFFYSYDIKIVEYKCINYKAVEIAVYIRTEMDLEKPAFYRS